MIETTISLNTCVNPAKKRITQTLELMVRKHTAIRQVYSLDLSQKNIFKKFYNAQILKLTELQRLQTGRNINPNYALLTPNYKE